VDGALEIQWMRSQAHQPLKLQAVPASAQQEQLQLQGSAAAVLGGSMEKTSGGTAAEATHLLCLAPSVG
jgi:hypothetical protein